MSDIVTLDGAPFVAEEMQEKPTLRDPVKQLRIIADEIERGDYGAIGCLAVCLMGDQVHVFGGGEKGDAGDVALLLDACKLRLVQAVESHGR